MELDIYADAIRRHDWTAGMSDSRSVAARGRKGRAKLAEHADLSKNHARLWELGRTWHANFTWSAPSPRCSEEKRYEDGWRWVGAYCWAKGLRLSEDEAKALVEGLGVKDKHNRHLAGTPLWKEIDALLKAVKA